MEKKLTKFENGVRLENGKLLLPEKVLVEQGIVKINCYPAIYGVVGDGVNTGVSRFLALDGTMYVVEVSADNATLAESDVVDLEKLCNAPFYVYSGESDLYLIAPGFIVKSGRFEGIIGLCFNRETIPTKIVELKAGSPPEEAVGLVELTPEGFKSSVSWLFKALATTRVIYDAKAGVYRVVEEPVNKPKARSAKLEICYQRPRNKWKCTTIAETRNPNTQVTGELAWSVDKNLVFVTRGLVEKVLVSRLREAVKMKGGDGRIVLAGYAPQHVKARLVLNIPLGEDITYETYL